MTGARETGADAECLKMLKDAMLAMDMIKGGTTRPIAMIRLDALT